MLSIVDVRRSQWYVDRSGGQTVGRSNSRTIGQSDGRTVGRSEGRGRSGGQEILSAGLSSIVDVRRSWWCVVRSDGRTKKCRGISPTVEDSPPRQKGIHQTRVVPGFSPGAPWLTPPGLKAQGVPPKRRKGKYQMPGHCSQSGELTPPAKGIHQARVVPGFSPGAP